MIIKHFIVLVSNKKLFICLSSVADSTVDLHVCHIGGSYGWRSDAVVCLFRCIAGWAWTWPFPYQFRSASTECTLYDRDVVCLPRCCLVASSWWRCLGFVVSLQYVLPLQFGWWFCKLAVWSTRSGSSVVVAVLVKIIKWFTNTFSMYYSTVRCCHRVFRSRFSYVWFVGNGTFKFRFLMFFLGKRMVSYYVLHQFSSSSLVVGQTHRQLHWMNKPVRYLVSLKCNSSLIFLDYPDLANCWFPYSVSDRNLARKLIFSVLCAVSFAEPFAGFYVW